MVSRSGTSAPGARGSLVCLHGAFAGSWCFDRLAPAFARAGWTVDAPDLQGHGARMGSPSDLVGVGLKDYRAELRAYLQGLPEPPVLVGHSMGALLAQQLAQEGLARALVLVNPAARAGILPALESERQAAKGLIHLGPFWDSVVHPNFEVAAADSLCQLPEAERRPVFDRFGPESGRVLFEIFFWMLDGTRASHVDGASVRCPVLCVAGEKDRLTSVETARATAAALPDATLRVVPDGGHMLPVEPGADGLAASILAWLDERVGARGRAEAPA